MLLPNNMQRRVVELFLVFGVWLGPSPIRSDSSRTLGPGPENKCFCPSPARIEKIRNFRLKAYTDRSKNIIKYRQKVKNLVNLNS